MPDLTRAQCQILRHMLGIDDPSEAHPVPYRDYFCAAPGDAELVELEQLGMVCCYRRGTEGDSCRGYDWYRTTDAGRAVAFASHRATRHSKKRRVYLKWLSVSDCCPDLTFGEFLKSSEWAEERRRC